MTLYLQDGWYTAGSPGRLRDAVIDGAMDTASVLYRAQVPPEAVTALALKVRTLAALVDPPHRRTAASPLGNKERSALLQRLQIYTDRFMALQCFINDAMDHVDHAAQLRALYLHLVHIAQMMQLLILADAPDAPRPGSRGPHKAATPAAKVMSKQR